MTLRYLTVDGMVSGTGIRDPINGGFVDPIKIGISPSLTHQLAQWQMQYEQAHYQLYADQGIVTALDLQGCELAKQVCLEIPSAKIKYFSDARMEEVRF